MKHLYPKILDIIDHVIYDDLVKNIGEIVNRQL